MRRLLLPAAICAVFALAGCAGSSSVASPAPAAGSQVFPVVTGASDPSAAFEVLRFYPSNIVIDAGDTLSWTIDSGSPHVVALIPAGQKPPAPPANIAPVSGTSFDGTVPVSSGLIVKGTTYSLVFPKPGTYTVLCLLHHPEMQQQVVVQPAGAQRPASAAQDAAAAATQSGADLAAAEGTLSAFPFTPGGTHLALGLSPKTTPPSAFSIYRFLDGPSLDASITVPTGTTLTWTNVSNVPHNVAFSVAGGAIPASFNDFGPPIGGSSYDGSALTSSGLLPPGTSYTLTFTKSGVYMYFCTLHDTLGMQSNVTVL